jgi:predicted acylesterase/phospholipase RssA
MGAHAAAHIVTKRRRFIMDQLSSAAIAAMAAKRRRVPARRPPFECIALLLQGGGALGSYQAGVYAALAEAELQPDWVAGISIGAINGALIAGNAPERRVGPKCLQSNNAEPMLRNTKSSDLIRGFQPAELAC